MRFQTRRDAHVKLDLHNVGFAYPSCCGSRLWCPAQAIGLSASPSQMPTLADGLRRPAPS